MPRVSAVPYSKMDPEPKAIVHASDEALNGSEWVQYFCHPKELYKSFVKFYYDHVATEEYGISWKLSEMMRHMVAVHNTCTLREQGLTDEMVAAIPKFRESTLFTPAEKAALGLANAMAGDHKQALYDEIFADLRKYYSEEQIVALGWKTGVCLGYGRLVHALDVPAVGESCSIPLKAASG